jgi:hypothetical protein
MKRPKSTKLLVEVNDGKQSHQWKSMMVKSLKSTKVSMEVNDGKKPNIDKVVNGGQ